MRIAFLDSWLQDVAEGSGTAAAIGGLAGALIARGHTVERLVPEGAWPRNLLLRRLWFNLTLPRRLAAAEGRYDLVVGFDIDGFRVAHRCPVPYVCCIKGVLAEESRCESGWPRLMLWGLSRLERLNARRAPLVLSTSRYCCERIEAHYGVPADRLRLVPEGIDVGLWNPAGGDDAAREPHTVLCVARQYPRKRVGDLITAFQGVQQRLPSARLVVIGDGPEHGALRELVERLGLGEVVRLLGALPDDGAVREWYRRSAVFCLPSIQEGFGIVFLEAMASGLPVVSTTATAIPEVVPHGKAGLLVPPRDPQGLAEAILKLLTDSALQAEQRAFGRAHVGPFSWDRVAERFLEVVSPPAAAGS
ncbi:glycosyltransferase family 4 protein [Synechococcus sp. BO 8801]|uniref:glycosyltransferase family 4 protein n=1 Tax=Synechococcus sp. BO 8801 TaxID=169670 RepID=UPI000B99B306|nr:glycosyltransferase family 4 protein [Synechococcus sp. BO 8801]